MIILKTPAKVNIGLWVERRRKDGYHDLRSLFFPVSLFDTLRIEKIPEGIELACEAPYVPKNDKNLVWKAAYLFFTYTGIRSGVKVELGKEIPVGNGLGGGSSDAAATLLGMDKLFQTSLSADELFSLSLELGMDCPFFLDPRPSLVTGRGEELKPVDIPSFDLAVYSPEFNVPTPWAYRHLRRLTKGGNPCKLLAKALSERSYQEAGRWLYNSFEEVVYKRYPILEDMAAWFLSQGAAFSGLSGSGAALFAFLQRESGDIDLPESAHGRLYKVRTLKSWGVV
ncbi:4-(cytidine 5'-diphospho)-2-C-methyl-D-erythritol kinase [candidate division WOR-3 bacterium]|uniref:4-diphosphocytidyl-2-C-methyl-D-erythritol kinase n=1 Tax=candidate division WOR-3 bacterium TaxID=2052148 RepID=A0A9D5K8J4_UNCW3|nr:4-(cytidine 5'-diphospho)-2-C-methyl-D-erythritol kinase [candidate division WOR-3 bacterium]MBD3363595.1 4-(cytidine 5'-diphospho)-2-C-methyl-D-erythritol kinase [candidate division WOR-3 bacterium]